MAQLFQAQLDGYELRILDISDTVSSAIVRHEFINTDGARLENMGLHPREVRFRAFFFGENSNAPLGIQAAIYVNHFDFLTKILDKSTFHTLIHPKYGQLVGYIESTTMMHDDTQDFVAIDIAFIEEGIQTTQFTSDITAIDQIVAQQQLTLLNNQIANLNSTMSAGGASAILGKVLDATKSISQQITGLSQQARDFTRMIDTQVQAMNNVFSDVATSVNGIDSAVAYIGDVPSRVIGSITGACNRIVATLTNVTNLPAQFINSLKYNMDQLGAVGFKVTDLSNTLGGQAAQAIFGTQIIKVSAGVMATQGASLYQLDQNNVQLAKTQESQTAFDAKGRRINTITIPDTMTVQDIESILYTIRQYLQTAITDDRTDFNLQQMAQSLADYVSNIKLTKEKIQVVNVTTIPLMVLMSQMGLPYEMADRVRKINPTQLNPTFYSGAVNIYVS